MPKYNLYTQGELQFKGSFPDKDTMFLEAGKSIPGFNQHNSFQLTEVTNRKLNRYVSTGVRTDNTKLVHWLLHPEDAVIRLSNGTTI